MNDNESVTMGGTGYLVVRVSTALGAIPVAGAIVTVRDDQSSEESAGGAVHRVLTTNRDGKTPRIPLDAPPRQNSMTQNASPPYATYHIDVEAVGYYSQTYNNVPIYDGITSIQPALLVPIAQNPNIDRLPEDERIFNENVNPALRPNR